jgi:hypothetical protein
VSYVGILTVGEMALRRREMSMQNLISELIRCQDMSPDVKGDSAEWKRICSKDLLAT